ncbi:hypothetical protein [Picosynechococcus sp. NKBG042902]|uniref:hypothetical protein n=1 Tax=Picosynechococcus sp. NKBG042902 TaxID=490193 RepID=UPI0004AA6ABE|nr:hypothetical protein [Picosynechococcus sp. NKBG042902]
MKKMISKIINHRSQIWQKYDDCVELQKELSSYSGQFSAANISQNIPLLTGTETPPDELAASVWQLKQESERIRQAKSQIEQYQAEIEDTRRQFFILVGIVVFIVIIFFLVLLGN